jgi:hypothetical protein
LSMGVLSCAEIDTDRLTDNIIVPILFMICNSFN